MKKALMFDVFGKYGFFKNHESNSVYMSYQFIHRPAVLGLLGAMVGLDGWRQMKEHDGKLEYYEVFKNSKISIIPSKPYFDTFYETNNNCTGFVNKGGANAIVKKQILQNPRYTIVIQQGGIEEKYYNKLKEMLFKGESIYRLCLGGNNYTANIDNVKEIELQEFDEKDEIIINSLIKEDEIEEMYEENEDGQEQYESHIYLPVDYNVETDYGHKKEEIAFSNNYLSVKNDCKLFEYEGNIYYFM